MSKINYNHFKKIVCDIEIKTACMDTNCSDCKRTEQEIDECYFDLENNCEHESDEA